MKKMDQKKFLKRMEELKNVNKLDLSLNEDLSIAIMNLISLEEHFFFTGAKTKKSKYYELIEEVREMRKKLLKKIVKNPEGEEWCISKHLLAASMRLMEVGTKLQSQGEKEKAQETFSQAYDLYSLFWGINLKMIEGKDVVGEISDSPDSQDKDITKRLNDLVEDLVDCCDE